MDFFVLERPAPESGRDDCRAGQQTERDARDQARPQTQKSKRASPNADQSPTPDPVGNFIDETRAFNHMAIKRPHLDRHPVRSITASVIS
jgi:hypothetical protein